tara:strand:+ start:47 stop:514 length:468 start_codon:yes stop_codon:yes gene_type:complete
MTVKNGDKVSVEYEGKLETGEVFDSSKHDGHDHPITFEVGAKQVVPGFEKAVVGMKKGESKEFTLKPEEAYGQPNPELVKKFPKKNLPEGQEPQAGQMIALGTPDGKQIPATIKEVGEEDLTLDLNHPLAGKTLNFSIKVVGVNEPESEGEEHQH